MDEEKSKLVTDNINLIYTVANKYYKVVSHLFDYDDTVGICSEALVKAALYYDSTKNVKFSTYAYNAMKNNLLSIFNWQLQKRNNTVCISLDAVQTDNDMTLANVIPSEFNLENHIVDADSISKLYKYIGELSEENQQIILLHMNGYTFEKISQKLNKNFAYVYSQHQRAINILRYKFSRREFEDDD